MPQVAIYALCDPQTKLCRYVGQSVQPFERFRAHLTPTGFDATSPKGLWIDQLNRQGYEPSLKILEWVPESEASDAEVFWINYLTWLGCSLTNSTGIFRHGILWRRAVMLDTG